MKRLFTALITGLFLAGSAMAAAMTIPQMQALKAVTQTKSA